MHREEKLLMLKIALDRRHEGHTFAMVNGLMYSNPLVLIKEHDHRHYIERMARRRLNIVSWDEFEWRSRGIDGAIVIDHAALSVILGDALELLREARAENYRLRDEIRALKERSM